MCTSGSSDNSQGPSVASTTASQGAPLAPGMSSSQTPETFNFQCSNVQPGTGRFFTDLISGQSRSHNMSLSGQYDVQPPYPGSSSMLESAASFSSGKKWIPNGKEGLTEVDARLLLPDYSCSSIIEEQGPGQNYLSENPRLHGNLLRYNSAPSNILCNSEAYREQDLHQGSRSLNESSQNSAILPKMFGTGLPPLPNPNASTSDRDHLSEYNKSYSGKQCEIGFSNQSSVSTNVTAEHSLMGYGRNLDVSSGSFSGFRLASLNHQMNKAENLFGNPISKGNLMRHSSSPASLLSKLESEGRGLSGSSDDDLSDHDIGDMKLPGDVKLGGSGDGTHPLFKNLQNGGMSMRKRSRDDSPERQRNLMEHHTSPMLTRHMSLPVSGRTTVPLLAENLLQDSVPCRLRAKRGCATHPRSIAERVRRTRISERMRKLQELVPNMDKQTNTSDMLDEAIVYVKFLQQKVKEINDCRTKCQGLCKSDSNGGDQQ